MRQLSIYASYLALYLSLLGLLAMTSIIAWQVFARYVLNAAPAWTEQAALFLMLWFILFAAAAGVREGFHIRLSLLQDAISRRKRKGLRILCNAIVLCFSAAMAFSGVQLMLATWEHVIPSLGLSRGLAYVPLAGSGALAALFALEHILADWNDRAVEPIWN